MTDVPSTRIAALDIGTSAIRAAIVEIDVSGKVDIVALGEAPSNGIDAGCVVDPKAASSAVDLALRNTQSSTRNPITRVVVGVSGKHFASLNARGIAAVTRTTRRVTQDDLIRVRDQTKIIVLPPDREIVHCIPRSYRLDGQDKIVSPIGMYCTRLELEAHLVTGSLTHLLNTRQAVLSAGCLIDCHVFNTVALSHAVLTKSDRDKGVVSVNIGAGTTEVSVYRDGTPYYSSVLPLGGSDITRDLSLLYHVSFDEAERLKIKYGRCSMAVPDAEPTVTSHDTTFSREGVRRAVECRIDQIAQLVRHEIIKSGCYRAVPSGAVLSGGVSGTPGITNWFEYVLEERVTIAEPKYAVTAISNEPPLIYATVVGLALFAAATLDRQTKQAHSVSRQRTFYDRFLAGVRHVFE